MQPVQKIGGQQFVVVGDGQTACGGRVESGDHYARRRAQVLFPTGESLPQLLLILAGSGRPLNVSSTFAAHGACHLGNLDALGTPANKGPPAKRDALVGHQPPQGVVGLLGCGIAYRRGLRRIVEPSPVCEAAGVIGGDQLGVSVDGDNPFWMLSGGSFHFAGNHAQCGRRVRPFRGGVVDKCFHKRLVCPARSVEFFP